MKSWGSMSLSEEIGGYFGMDLKQENSCFFHDVLLNTARNALRYIIRAYHIKKIAVPRYTCPVVWQAVRDENADIVFYGINEQLEAELPDLPSDAFILLNDFFGVKEKYIERMAEQHANLIVDDAQSLFAPKAGLAHFKSPRKFLPLPDGGIAVCDRRIDEDLPQDESWGRCLHLLIRSDVGANSGFREYQKNDAGLDGLPVKRMSNLTMMMLESYDFEKIKKKRLSNFNFLHSHLCKLNGLDLRLSDNDVPMVYPFLNKKKNLRSILIAHRIYVARYWPGIESECGKESFEICLQNNLLPLPVDQRYGEKDMKRILEIIHDN